MIPLRKSQFRSFTLLLVLLSGFSAGLRSQATDQDPVPYGSPFKQVPDREDVSIYQVNIRAFSKEGNFKGVSARLDSIKALGVNVIYLMPHYPVGRKKSVNSPYCIKDYRTVNEEFGTLQDLRGLIEGAHQRRMAVILDWVANHTSYDHAWINNRDWYLQDSAGNIMSPPNMGWNDVAQLNFKNHAMRLALISAMKYWILASNADGFRCDYSDGPPLDFWKQAIDTLRGIPNRKLLLLSEGRNSELYKVGFDYNFGFKFFDKLKDISSHGHSVLAIDTQNIKDYVGAAPGQQMIRYTSNHDVNGSDGTPEELFGGESGAIAAFVVVAYMKSVPMIYNGQEVRMARRLRFPFTGQQIDWTKNLDVTATYKKIIAFRNANKAIRRGELTAYNNEDVCAFTKVLGKEKVLVIVNMRNRALSYPVPVALSNTTWKNAMDKRSSKLQNSIQLKPYEYLVFKN